MPSLIESCNERRSHHRYSVRGKVRIGDISGLLTNISFGGMLATLDGEPEDGRTYECCAELYGDSGPVVLNMTVVARHVQRVGHRHEFRVGIEFDQIPEATHWLLMEFLAEG